MFSSSNIFIAISGTPRRCQDRQRGEEWGPPCSARRWSSSSWYCGVSWRGVRSSPSANAFAFHPSSSDQRNGRSFTEPGAVIVRRMRGPRRGFCAADRVRAVCRSCARGEVEERRAGRVDRPGDVPRARHAERRDPGGLRVPCDQSHGLVADGSDRNEQHRVDAVLEEPVGQTGGEILGGAAGGVDPAHERVEAAREPPRNPSRARRCSVSIGKTTFGSERASDRS